MKNWIIKTLTDKQLDKLLKQIWTCSYKQICTSNIVVMSSCDILIISKISVNVTWPPGTWNFFYNKNTKEQPNMLQVTTLKEYYDSIIGMFTNRQHACEQSWMSNEPWESRVIRHIHVYALGNIRPGVLWCCKVID